MATNFEPHERVIFVESMKIGTHENKAIHSTCLFRTMIYLPVMLFISLLKVVCWFLVEYYRIGHVEKAAELQAIETLLISDALFRYLKGS